MDLSIITEVIDYGYKNVLPEASIIIITYNTDTKLLTQNLNSLNKQTTKDFEIVIVDNSDNIDIKQIVSKFDLKYIKLDSNYGLTRGRNIGIRFAKGNIVIFLDDDAIPTQDYVEKHIKAFAKYNIFGLRGKALPRTNAIYNYLASHYDLGDQTIPWLIDLEGNSSFKRDILIEVGGFNPGIQRAGGHEGTELSYRILARYKDKSRLVYYPEAIIYHDYSDTFVQYVKKRLRHAKYKDLVRHLFPDILDFTRIYKLEPNKTKKYNPNLFIKIKLVILILSASFIVGLQKLKTLKLVILEIGICNSLRYALHVC